MQQMNKTGTGFKTLKLRSSHSFRPQSAYQEQIVSIIPFEMSEQAYSTSLKMDLLNIEDEISKLNKLGIQQSRLNSNHTQKIKQWISNIKMNDKCLDPQRVIQICNCSDANETLVKLYNMIQNFDFYVNKITELQCIHYLQYEQCFTNFQSNYFQKIASQGILPNRIIEYLVQKKGDLNHSNGESILQQKLYELKDENLKLLSDIKQLKSQCRKLQDQLQNSTTLSQSQLSQVTVELPPNPTSYYNKVIDEVKDSYQNLVTMLRDENLQLGLRLSEMQSKYTNASNEIIELNKKVDSMKTQKDDLYKRFVAKYKTTEEFEQSYEAALKEEYTSMEISFKQKISQLQHSIDQNSRDYQKKLLEQKQVIDQQTDRERMLIKKMSLYQKL
ncbi:unnamed protein product (macronuclear) [Paramecium tetraurelia]|uniref:Uncharacterized protein n=1 Tax=Paramecium tetraurelia TaxID=5888 RepID=A0D567_PARTE|nr:uncharacterized protein GSPATT00013631001 [Paramecium tetraurelia]CAK78184.1 unnamed protein product [Paramecium tetraurelia]|eukprot:XP_001445581.1 hypothetical protein (macronuclear) [Paramecium tetraurelia strain d4-2]